MNHRFHSIRSVLGAAILIAATSLTAFCAEGTPDAGTGGRKLTLADAVLVALTNNVTLRSAYLDRYLQRMDLQLAERNYYLPTDPKLTLSLNRSSAYQDSDTGSLQDLNANGVVAATLALPTGGSFTFAWNNHADRPDTGQKFAYSSDWDVTFRQPLLKGGGLENAAYSVRIARITEQRNLLSLRDTLAATIKTTITAFRNFKNAERQLVIADMALARSRALYEYNREMIAAGRLAGTEIVQAQADIANQEGAVISAKNNLDAARLTLLQAMYLDKKTAFQAVDEGEQVVPPPPLEEAIALAFQYRTDYLRTLKDLETKQLALDKARRNRLWSLNLTAGTTDSAMATTFDYYDAALRRSVSSGPERNWNAGLTLEIPLVPLTSDMRSYLGAKTDLEKANLAFEKLKTDIEINVQSGIRNVDSNYRSLLSAKQARELAERKLAIEQEKLGAGRTTNFQLVSFQRDVQTAQNAEVTAMTSYLNSLTDLDETLGTTLATWKIEVKAEDDRFQPSGEGKRAILSNPGDPKNVQ
ncbi:MAG: TolC family protein [Deltaproteobacteria bacterium]|nr:TolC family protein [Deltaproteobacteria bacterium]